MSLSVSFLSFNLLAATTSLSSIEPIANFMSDSLKSIHSFSLALALLIMLYAIVRNYTQFGQDIGLKFIASLLCIMVLFFAFPKVSDSLRNKLENFTEPVAEEIDSLHKTLLSTSNNQSYGNINSNVATNVIKSLTAENSGITFYGAITYWGGTWIAKNLRDFIYLITLGSYNVALVLSPIFLSFLLIAELKSIGVNFLTAALALIMMPLCNLFGDLCYLWLVFNTWNTIGLDTNSTSSINSSLALIPVFPSLIAILFGLTITIIAIFVYIFIPIIFFKLFRTGSATIPAGLAGMLIGKSLGAFIASSRSNNSTPIPQDIPPSEPIPKKSKQ